MNRKLIWGIPIAMVILGLMIVLIGHLQPKYTATVIEKGQVSYTPAKKFGRTRHSSRYSLTLTVTYVNDQGDNVSTQVQFLTIHPHDIPEIGDQIDICRGLRGMVTHPNGNLVALGGTSAVIGGFLLTLFLLTRWSMNRERRRSQGNVPPPSGTR